MGTTILIPTDDTFHGLVATSLLNAQAPRLCIDWREPALVSRESVGALEDDGSADESDVFPPSVESVRFETISHAQARARRLSPDYNYAKRDGALPQILGFSVKLRGLDEAIIDAWNRALAATSDSRRFTVEGEGEPFSYASMLAANAEDDAFLAWMTHAPVGAQWSYGNRVQRVA